MDWLSLLFGFLDSRNQKKDAKAAREYAEEFAKAVAFKPWDVSGPLGSATFEDGTATTTFSPEMQNQLTGLFSQASGYGDALSTYDPAAAQQEMYQQQRSLFAPQQSRDRLALESRLLNQGMFGSTGGAGITQSLLESQGQQDLASQVAAWEQSQQYQQNLQQGYNSTMDTIFNMGNSISGLFGTGAGLGAEESLAAYRGGEAVLGAKTMGDTGGFQWSKLGGNNKDFDLSFFTDYWNKTKTPTSPTTPVGWSNPFLPLDQR
jgi:hypothetical protein